MPCLRHAVRCVLVALDMVARLPRAGVLWATRVGDIFQAVSSMRLAVRRQLAAFDIDARLLGSAVAYICGLVLLLWRT